MLLLAKDPMRSHMQCPEKRWSDCGLVILRRDCLMIYLARRWVCLACLQPILRWQAAIEYIHYHCALVLRLGMKFSAATRSRPFDRDKCAITPWSSLRCAPCLAPNRMSSAWLTWRIKLSKKWGPIIVNKRVTSIYGLIILGLIDMAHISTIWFSQERNFNWPFSTGTRDP